MSKVGKRDAGLFYPMPVHSNEHPSFLSEVTSTAWVWYKEYKEAGLPPSDPADDGALGGVHHQGQVGSCCSLGTA